MKLHKCVYLRAKFEVSSIILMSFRQRVILPLPTSKRTPKKPTQIRVNGKHRKEKQSFSIAKEYGGHDVGSV